MNYEETKAAITRLVDEVEASKGSRINRELEPLREALVEARRKGVTLRRLHQLLKQQGFDYSPSAFGKYAQRNLQTGLRKPPAKSARSRRTAPSGAGKRAAQAGPRIAAQRY